MSGRIFDDAFMRRLENLSLRFASPVSSSYGGGRRSNTRGSTVEFYNFREYNQGDDFRRIDWNAYARFEKFFIKLFLDERQLNIHILADTSESMSFGEPSKHFAAMRLAAAFAFMSVGSQDRASVISLSGGSSEPLAEGITGMPSFYRALEKLESAPTSGGTDLCAAVKSCRGIRPGDGVTVLLSDLMCESGYRDAIDYLLFLRQQVVLVHILSPEETDPKLEGRLRLTDSETGAFCDITAGAAALSYYKKALADYTDGIKEYCLSRGVYFLPVVSDEDIASVLLERGFGAGIVQ